MPKAVKRILQVLLGLAVAAVAVFGIYAPYQKGVTYRVTVDGFIVSGNVGAHAENIETDYEFGDHNPVKLAFTLE